MQILVVSPLNPQKFGTVFKHSINSNLGQKCSRNNEDCQVQEEQLCPDYDGGNRTQVSYARVVKFNSKKLTVKRKESEWDGGMYGTELGEVQNAIMLVIIFSAPSFPVRMERTFIYEKEVLLI